MVSAILWQSGNDGFGAFAHATLRVPMNRHVSLARTEKSSDAALLQLTDGQKDCLRLVYNHMTSKDIARILGVSPHTVDMRLRTAMKVLSVTTRIDAARLFVCHETSGELKSDTYQPLIYTSPDMAPSSESGSLGSSASAAGETFEEPDPAWMIDRQTLSPAFDPLVSGPPRETGASATSEVAMLGSRSGAGTQDEGSGARPLASPLPWGSRNTLSVPARLAWIVGIAIGSALSFGAILSALESLKSLI